MGGQLVRHFFVFFWLTGFLSWFPAAYYYVILLIKLGRARQDGVDLPTGGRGIPLVLVFTDYYPPARPERLKLVFWICIFLGSVVALFAVAVTASLLGIKW
jgi:hypothetical protein